MFQTLISKVKVQAGFCSWCQGVGLIGEAGHQPCCGVTEAGADGPGEKMWSGGGAPGV